MAQFTMTQVEEDEEISAETGGGFRRELVEGDVKFDEFGSLPPRRCHLVQS